MQGHFLRLWPNIKSTWGQRLLFAGGRLYDIRAVLSATSFIGNLSHSAKWHMLK